LPTIFVPAGPMTSGLSNDDKAKIRQQFATGGCDRGALLEAEAAAYHSHGTCTFYGTANSNQMLLELMGMHLPGSAFVHPHTPLRDALTAQAARRVLDLTVDRGHYMPIGHVVDEKAVVNGIVALLATGGSSNHTLHLTQKGNDLGGFHQGEFTTREITGAIDGDSVRIRSAFGEQHGDSINLTFNGKLTGDQMSGALDMGEYLGATWTATRRAARRG